MKERAEIAMHMAAGWLASYPEDQPFNEKMPASLASCAVRFADALLAELGKSEAAKPSEPDAQPAAVLVWRGQVAASQTGNQWIVYVHQASGWWFAGRIGDPGVGEPGCNDKSFPSEDSAKCYCELEEARLLADARKPTVTRGELAAAIIGEGVVGISNVGTVADRVFDFLKHRGVIA